MSKQTKKPKYPILAVRVKQKEWDYIRHEADERGLTVARYVRAMLIPFNIPAPKIVVDKRVTV